MSERQLAAIMFTDIVGYTALMGKDTHKALEIVRISKDIQKPLVEKHNGKWLKELGDGAMAQFNTALDAVNCSIDIQESARAKLDAKLRIGIHLGDITIENDDVYGDGVNVASRLESIADQGGIYISESIEKAIQGQSDVQAKYLGEVKLKNVAYGVRTYALQGVGLPVPDTKEEKELSGRFLAELQRRGVLRAGATYLGLSLLMILLLPYANTIVDLPTWSATALFTVLIVGFPIALYMAWNYERSPEGFVRTTSQQSWQNPYPSSQRKPFTSNAIIAVLLFIIVFLLGYPRFLAAPTVSPLEELSYKSIAVIPFDDMSELGDQQYFADGVMDDILNHLQRMGELRVVSRTSVEQYRDTKKSAIEIGQELNVSYLLEGSIRKSPTAVMITAQLIDANDDKHMWGESYSSPYSAELLFDIQREISQKIVEELKLKILPEEVVEITRPVTTNTAAYEHFLRGREYYGMNNDSAISLAIGELRKAIELDSNFAASYGLLANAFGLKWFSSSTLSWLDSTEAYARTGLDLYKDCAECYKALSFVEYGKYKSTRGGIEMLERALEINPNYAKAAYNLRNNYITVGRMEEAIALTSRFVNRWGMLVLYQEIGDYEKAGDYVNEFFRREGGIEAIGNLSTIYHVVFTSLFLGNVEQFELASFQWSRLTNSPVANHTRHIGSYFLEKDYDGIIRYYDEQGEGGVYMQAGPQYWFVAGSFMQQGDTVSMRQLAEEGRRTITANSNSESKFYAFDMAITHLLISETDDALAWLTRAVDRGFMNPLDHFSFYPLFQQFSDNPTFKELVASQDKRRAELLELMAAYDFPEPKYQ